jgi:hypothetical protein
MWGGPPRRAGTSNVVLSHPEHGHHCCLRRCSRRKPVNMAEQHYTRTPSLGLPRAYYEGNEKHFEGMLQWHAAAVELAQ